MLPFANRQFHDPVESNVMHGNGSVNVVVLIAIQLAAWFQNGARIETGWKYARSEVGCRIQNVVAERVSTHAEGARVNIENLIGDSFLERALIVDLQRAIVGPASLQGDHVAAPSGLVIGARCRSGKSAGRRYGSRGRFPDTEPDQLRAGALPRRDHHRAGADHLLGAGPSA